MRKLHVKGGKLLSEHVHGPLGSMDGDYFCLKKMQWGGCSSISMWTEAFGHEDVTCNEPANCGHRPGAKAEERVI